MHDPLLVHRREPGGQLPRDRQGLSGRQPAPVQARAKRLALEELGDEVRRTLVRADVVDRQHVRVVQGPGRARLALEALPPLGRGHVAGQHLDRDVAAEAPVASAVHLAHSPGADRREDLVDAEASADRQAHRPRAGDARVARDMSGCRLHGGLVEEPRRLAVVAEQRLHLPPERLVTGARRLEERPSARSRSVRRPRDRGPRPSSSGRCPSIPAPPAQFSKQPRLGELPVAEHRLRRDSQDLGRLVRTQATEVAKLHDAGLARVDGGESP